MTRETSNTVSYGGWLLAAASAVGLILALYAFLAPETGVTHSYGAGLVVISTLLLTAAAMVVLFDHEKPAWLAGALYVATILDILGTGFAAYFLEARWLVGAMVAALVGWLIHVIADPSDEERAAAAIRKEVLS